MLHEGNQAVTKFKNVTAFLFTNKMTNYSNIINDIFVDLNITFIKITKIYTKYERDYLTVQMK